MCTIKIVLYHPAPSIHFGRLELNCLERRDPSSNVDNEAIFSLAEMNLGQTPELLRAHLQARRQQMLNSKKEKNK